jgi:D-3-phosphoglycerate dehydrogenase / 2-oxoglutarate reductase
LFKKQNILNNNAAKLRIIEMNKEVSIQTKILIVDEVHPSLFEMLTQAGFLYDYQPALKRPEIIKQIVDYEGLIIRSKTTIDELFLENATRLKFIARAGAGLDLIDVTGAKKRNIAVFAANEGNRDAVAEHTVGLLLALMSNIAKADREVRNNVWDREGNRGYEIMGKTIGLLGYGFNGRATAQRLSGFGCRVLAYDKYLVDYSDTFVEESSIKKIMEEADILSIHLPLTVDTRWLIDDDFIAKMTKPFYFINIARGEITDLEAVVRGLKNGKIRGACLDVLANEKLQTLTPTQQQTFDYLRNTDRVVLTPHIAGWSHESYIKINEVLVKQILANG